jgi:hypothetical protein
MTIKVKMACLGLTCLLFLASGCVEFAMLYHGKTVSNVPVVALQEGGPVTGQWKTFDLVIDYEYIKKGDNLDISGKAALSQHYQMTYEWLVSMRTYIFFLDKDSRVLETANFAAAWSGSTQDPQNFSESYKIPQGTAGISFGYSGQVRDERSGYNFYELPLD